MKRWTNHSRVFIFIGGIIHLLIFFTPFGFASNDDAMMMSLLNGTYTGHPEGYAVFIHPILSELISLLYKCNNQFPWYPFLWFMFSFLAYVAVVNAVAIRGGKAIYQLLWIVAYLLFSVHHLFLLQFTVIAGVLALSGYLLLFESKVFSPNNLHLNGIFAIFLVILSILVRIDVFFLTTLGLGFFYGFKYGLNKLLTLLYEGRYLWIVVIFLVVLVPLYEKVNGYNEYVKFNKARAKVIDHPVLWFKTPGINKIESPDLYFFRNWLFEDNPNVTLSFLQAMQKELNSDYFSSNYFFHGFKRIADFQEHHNFSLFILLLYLLLLLSLDTVRKKNLFFVMTWVIFFLVFNHFYLVPQRVQSLFGLQLLGAAWLCKKQVSLKPPILIFTVTLISVILLIHVLRITENLKVKNVIINELKLISLLIPKNEIAFTDLIGTESIDPQSFHTKNDIPFIYFGWHSKSPMQAVALAKFGYENLGEIETYYFLTICGNRLVIPEYLNYLNRKTYKKELIASEGGFLLFKYTK